MVSTRISNATTNPKPKKPNILSRTVSNANVARLTPMQKTFRFATLYPIAEAQQVEHCNTKPKQRSIEDSMWRVPYLCSHYPNYADNKNGPCACVVHIFHRDFPPGVSKTMWILAAWYLSTVEIRFCNSHPLATVDVTTEVFLTRCKANRCGRSDRTIWRRRRSSILKQIPVIARTNQHAAAVKAANASSTAAT